MNIKEWENHVVQRPTDKLKKNIDFDPYPIGDVRNNGFNGSNITSSCWREVVEEFWIKSFKKDTYNDHKIKSKYLSTYTKQFKDIFQNFSRYGWDPETNTISCPSVIWADLANISYQHEYKYICSMKVH